MLAVYEFTSQDYSFSFSFTHFYHQFRAKVPNKSNKIEIKSTRCDDSRLTVLCIGEKV
jgi:hypothetical protein